MVPIYKSDLHFSPRMQMVIPASDGWSKALWFVVGSAVGLAVAAGAGFLWYGKHQRDHSEEHARQLANAKISQLDASVFQASVAEPARPVSTGELMMPGLVARIYESQPSGGHKNGGKAPDVGSFVLSVPIFQLNAHRDHAIGVSGSAIYRLNAMYSALHAGTHQFKVSLRLGEESGPNPKQRETALAYTRCDVSAIIAGETLVSSRLTFDDEHEAHLWSSAELSEGAHPAEFRIQCDTADPKARVEMEKAMRVAVETRSPHDNHAVLNRDAFWYKAVQARDASPTAKVSDLRLVDARSTTK